MVCRNWRQFCCLQWKNYLLQKKKKIQTIFIVLLPIFPAIVSVFVRGHEDSVGYSVDEHTYDSFTLEPGSQSRGWTLTYAPNTTLVAGIMNRTATILGTRIKRGTFNSSTVLLYLHVKLYQLWNASVAYLSCAAPFHECVAVEIVVLLRR